MNNQQIRDWYKHEGDQETGERMIAFKKALGKSFAEDNKGEEQ
jgi:hypothetical protein